MIILRIHVTVLIHVQKYKDAKMMFKADTRAEYIPWIVTLNPSIVIIIPVL